MPYCVMSLSQQPTRKQTRLFFSSFSFSFLFFFCLLSSAPWSQKPEEEVLATAISRLVNVAVGDKQLVFASCQ